MALRTVWIGVSVVLASLSHTAVAATLNVPAQHATIQGAINAAVAGDQIVVAPGYYSERIDMKGKAITLKSSAGAAQTFISPNGVSGAIVSCVTAESASCIVEGFTINGATGPGIAVTSSSPVFKWCAINQNYNTAANGGGVAYTGTGGSPRFENCQFFGNRAIGREGGGIAATSTNGLITCVNCAFSFNESTGSFGGAIYSTTTATVLTGCTFTSNAVNNGTSGTRRGGAIYISPAALTISDCAFTSNAVSVWGAYGDRRAEGGAIASAGAVSARNCSFGLNRVTGTENWNGVTVWAWGGALQLSGVGSVIFEACAFTSNLAENVGCSYGRDARGGAVLIQGGCDPVFDTCTFIGNRAENCDANTEGGTFWWDNGSAGSIVDCTISGSRANTQGGALFLNGGATPFLLRTTFSDCATTAVGANGGAIRAQDGANAYASDCRFTACSSDNGGAIYTRNSHLFIDHCTFDHNISAAGSAIRTEGSGIGNVPTIQSSTFCSNSGFSANWILGLWSDPFAGSNSFAADCGADCNANGIVDTLDIAMGSESDCDANAQPDSCQSDCDNDGTPNVCEISAGAEDCDNNGVPDLCQLAQGAPDLNNNGMLDSCEALDFIGLRTEIVPITLRSLDPTIPSNAICYRIYAEFTGTSSAVWGIYGNQDHPMLISATAGFYNASTVGNLSSLVPCDLSAYAQGAQFDSWLTVGASCANGNGLDALGFNFTNFSAAGINDNDCIAFVPPNSLQGVAGKDRRVLLANPTTVNGLLPTGHFNIVGRNAGGTDLLAFAQTWPQPSLVDCNGNGTHDAYDIRSGVDRDCDESGVPDSCEYQWPNEDCNNNGTPDLCDIQTGASADLNANRVPDECECAGDVDGDGTVNVDDVVAVILAWGDTGSTAAELNGDEFVNAADLSLILTFYGGCQ